LKSRSTPALVAGIEEYPVQGLQVLEIHVDGLSRRYEQGFQTIPKSNISQNQYRI
jgi:hypothetical protein